MNDGAGLRLFDDGAELQRQTGHQLGIQLAGALCAVRPRRDFDVEIGQLIDRQQDAARAFGVHSGDHGFDDDEAERDRVIDGQRRDDVGFEFGRTPGRSNSRDRLAMISSANCRMRTLRIRPSESALR